MKTLQPNFTKKPELSGKLEGGYEFNGKGKFGSFNMRSSYKRMAFLFTACMKDFENYKAGNEQSVLSSFS